MSTIRKVAVSLILLGVVANARPAKAETPPAVDSMFASLLPLLEGMVMGGILPIPGTVNLGGCTPAMTPGFPYVELRFTSSATCPLNGTVRLGLFPLSASVRLEFVGVPVIQAVDADFQMKLRRQNKITTLNWLLTNGRVAFRVMPDQPLVEYAMTGYGARQRSRSSLNVDGRMNFFDRGTGAGRAILRKVTRVSPDPTVRVRQVCILTGATADRVDSGTLSACTGSPE